MDTVKIYSVLDIKVGAFSQPFFSPNNATALRAFTDIVNEPGHTFNKHPEDYVLHELGHWNAETGAINSVQPIVVATASSVHRMETLRSSGVLA